MPTAIRNTHERSLSASVDCAGRLLDGLSSDDDRLWSKNWPPMRFDRPLCVGARGGHGPIRYDVVTYDPGQRVVFQFTAPRGFNGTHSYEILEAGEHVILRHDLQMTISGPALFTWPFAFRPLHDALIEDTLDNTGRFCGGTTPETRQYTLWVRFLRSLFRLLL